MKRSNVMRAIFWFSAVFIVLLVVDGFVSKTYTLHRAINVILFYVVLSMSYKEIKKEHEEQDKTDKVD